MMRLEAGFYLCDTAGIYAGEREPCHLKNG